MVGPRALRRRFALWAGLPDPDDVAAATTQWIVPWRAPLVFLLMQLPLLAGYAWLLHQTSWSGDFYWPLFALVAGQTTIIVLAGSRPGHPGPRHRVVAACAGIISMWVFALLTGHVLHAARRGWPIELAITLGAAVVGCYVFTAATRWGSDRQQADP